MGGEYLDRTVECRKCKCRSYCECKLNYFWTSVEELNENWMVTDNINLFEIKFKNPKFIIVWETNLYVTSQGRGEKRYKNMKKIQRCFDSWSNCLMLLLTNLDSAFHKFKILFDSKILLHMLIFHKSITCHCKPLNFLHFLATTFQRN